MSTPDATDTATDPTQAGIAAKLSTLDRFLPVWILAAMAVGLLVGRLVPGLGDALGAVAVDGVSLPIALGLLVMMYPVLAKVRDDRLGAVFGDRRRRQQRRTRHRRRHRHVERHQRPGPRRGRRTLIEVPVLVALVYVSLRLRRRLFPASDPALEETRRA